MKALLLAAGSGTRLGKLTKDIPKPMIEVAGKPILEHLIDHLNHFGISEIIVNLHYHPEVIMNHFGSRLLYFYEPELLGETNTILALRKWFRKDDFIVMNGDTLTNVDLYKMYRYHRKDREEKVTALWDTQDEVMAGTWIFGNNYFWQPWCRVERMTDIPARFFFATDYYWQDVGTLEGLKKAKEYYEKNKRV